MNEIMILTRRKYSLWVSEFWVKESGVKRGLYPLRKRQLLFHAHGEMGGRGENTKNGPPGRIPFSPALIPCCYYSCSKHMQYRMRQRCMCESNGIYMISWISLCPSPHTHHIPSYKLCVYNTNTVNRSFIYIGYGISTAEERRHLPSTVATGGLIVFWLGGQSKTTTTTCQYLVTLLKYLLPGVSLCSTSTSSLLTSMWIH